MRKGNARRFVDPNIRMVGPAMMDATTHPNKIGFDLAAAGPMTADKSNNSAHDPPSLPASGGKSTCLFGCGKAAGDQRPQCSELEVQPFVERIQGALDHGRHRKIFDNPGPCEFWHVALE